MISRRSARLLSELCEYRFRTQHKLPNGREYFTLNYSRAYDFLFDHDYPAWFCNAVKATAESVGMRKYKEFVMQLHTGESVAAVTSTWTWPQRERLGQQMLRDLSEDLLQQWENDTDEYTKRRYESPTRELDRSLALDGYLFRDGRLLEPESDALDAKEEAGVLADLINTLRLPNRETTLHHLDLSEEHFIAQKWDDSISNSRKFLESVLQETAVVHSEESGSGKLSDETYTRPAKVRDYLLKANLLEAKEKEALASVYGLLSNTGGHPYIAQNEQARLLRHMALTFAQFVLLRLRGFLESKKARG